MDRDDARFCADALEGRIQGNRELLDRLASTSFVRLGRSAARLKDLAADWQPALTAALELETIAMYGAKAAEGPASPDLQILVDKLRALADEPPAARNRFERRRQAKLSLSRRQRLTGIRAAACDER